MKGRTMKAAMRSAAGAENSHPVSVSPPSRGLPAGGPDPRTTVAPPGIAPMAFPHISLPEALGYGT